MIKEIKNLIEDYRKCNAFHTNRDNRDKAVVYKLVADDLEAILRREERRKQTIKDCTKQG